MHTVCKAGTSSSGCKCLHRPGLQTLRLATTAKRTWLLLLLLLLL
jgi:hypothetical protein